MDAKEFRDHLTEKLIPFWNKLMDEEYGGFYGCMDYNLTVFPQAEKGVILNDRILWFYSNAYLSLKDEALLEMAKHAYEFLKTYCMDEKYGGVYWSMNYDGSVLDDTKHTYNQAFAIYALSSYYDAGGDEEALQLAYQLYEVIENKCRDANGYLEAFTRDFTPESNEKLSTNGVIAERTTNTLLHVMEAYTELYRVDKSKSVGLSLENILDLIEKYVYDDENKACRVFFDREYNSLKDLHSFGHDIETAWLIDRACEVLDIPFITDKMNAITKQIVKKVYEAAFDSSMNALDYEREGNRINKERIWWVQAEAVVGFYNAYQKNPDHEEYKETAENIWEYIKQYFIDPRCGEWFWRVYDDGSADKEPMLADPWKCPYHNGRMCMEMIHRIEE